MSQQSEQSGVCGCFGGGVEESAGVVSVFGEAAKCEAPAPAPETTKRVPDQEHVDVEMQVAQGVLEEAEPKEDVEMQVAQEPADAEPPNSEPLYGDSVDLELADEAVAHAEDPRAKNEVQFENGDWEEPSDDQPNAKLKKSKSTLSILTSSTKSTLSNMSSIPTIVYGQPLVDLPKSFALSCRPPEEIQNTESEIEKMHEEEYKSVWPLTEFSFAILSIILNSLVCYLAFGLAPMHDIRKDHEIKYWYECALACSLIWVPVNIYNMLLMGNASLFRGLEKKCGIVYFVKAWIPGGMIMSACQYLYANHFAWPTPWLFVLTACPIIYCVAGGMMYFEIPKEHRVAMRLKTAVFSFYAFMAVVALLLTVCAAGFTNILFRLSGDMNLLGSTLMIIPICAVLPIMKMCNVFILQWLGRWVHDDLLIFSLTWCMTSHAACIPLALGSAEGVILPLALTATDFGSEFLALLCAFGKDLWCCGRECVTRNGYLLFLTSPLKVLLRKFGVIPKRKFTPEMISSIQDRWLLTFIAIEQGDIIVPTCLTAGWLTIYYAGQRSAFAGIGNDEMGFERPEATDGESSRVVNFVTNVAIFVGLNVILGAMVQVVMQSRYKVNIMGAQQWMLKKFGWEMLVQCVAIIYTVLCLLHLSCAIDISFKFKSVADPWGWFQSDQIPAMYVSRGHNATRPA